MIRISKRLTIITDSPRYSQVIFECRNCILVVARCYRNPWFSGQFYWFSALLYIEGERMNKDKSDLLHIFTISDHASFWWHARVSKNTTRYSRWTNLSQFIAAINWDDHPRNNVHIDNFPGLHHRQAILVYNYYRVGHRLYAISCCNHVCISVGPHI